MQLPPEDRVNMSLDDLILAQKKQGPKGGNNSQGQSQGGNRRRNNRRPQSANSAPQQRGGKPNNAIVSVGANKAKRSATMNQRRGLNNSGIATKADIQNSIRTQASNSENRNNRRRRRGNNIGGGAAGGGPGAVTTNRSAPISRPPPTAKPVGLKISFNPADLNKTTDKAVAVQIKAALAKQIASPRQSTPIPPPNFLAPGSLSRQVFMPGSTGGAAVARGQQGRNRPRGQQGLGRGRGAQRRPVKG